MSTKGNRGDAELPFNQNLLDTDHYAVLGVPQDATEEEIKKAFRRLARELHPDVNPDPKTQERFKEINSAYDILGDPRKKGVYDEIRATPDVPASDLSAPNSGFGGPNDPFASFFGGGGRTADDPTQNLINFINGLGNIGFAQPPRPETRQPETPQPKARRPEAPQPEARQPEHPITDDPTTDFAQPDHPTSGSNPTSRHETLEEMEERWRAEDERLRTEYDQRLARIQEEDAQRLRDYDERLARIQSEDATRLQEYEARLRGDIEPLSPEPLQPEPIEPEPLSTEGYTASWRDIGPRPGGWRDTGARTGGWRGVGRPAAEAEPPEPTNERRPLDQTREDAAAYIARLRREAEEYVAGNREAAAADVARIGEGAAEDMERIRRGAADDMARIRGEVSDRAPDATRNTPRQVDELPDDDYGAARRTYGRLSHDELSSGPEVVGELDATELPAVDAPNEIRDIDF